MSVCISAVQHVRSLRGGAQSQLLKASDGNYYVVKFQNNPQHIRVLANEMFATRLGLKLGLPMPRVEVIDVSDRLIEHSPELRLQLGGEQVRCKSGKQLGSLYVGQNNPGLTFDYAKRCSEPAFQQLSLRLLRRSSSGSGDVRQEGFVSWSCRLDGRNEAGRVEGVGYGGAQKYCRMPYITSFYLWRKVGEPQELPQDCTLFWKASRLKMRKIALICRRFDT